MLAVKDARVLLGESGRKMTDAEIEKLIRSLYSFVNQVFDNHQDSLTICKKP